jgi:hypothetical protein
MLILAACSMKPSKRYRAKLLIDEYLRFTPRNGRYSDEQKRGKHALEYKFFHPSAPSHSEEGVYESLAGLLVSHSPDGVGMAL